MSNKNNKTNNNPMDIEYTIEKVDFKVPEHLSAKASSMVYDLTRQINKLTVAKICKRCAICEEDTVMSSNDYRTNGVFICDRCKTAILYIRKFLEDGGNLK